LARAGDLGEDEEHEDGEGAVRYGVAAREDNEERSHVVRDEEHVARVEGHIVEQIREEVGGAEIEDQFLEGSVGRCEAPLAVGEKGSAA